MAVNHLPDVREDRERRNRGISLPRWRAAPPTPATRDVCENGPRPCPHLRCKYHLGERGDRSFSCELDFNALPAEERTFQRIGDVLGVTRQTAEDTEAVAWDKFEQRATPELVKLLRIRRRPARQP